MRPLSPIEATLFTLDRARSLNFAAIASLRGPLSEAALRRGLDAAARRHPMLRVRIAFSPPEVPAPRFEAEGVGPIPLATMDLDASEAEGLRDVIEAELNTPIPAAAGPLVRARWVRHGAEAHHLLVTFHHVVGDGLSGVLLLRDILRAAAAHAVEEPAEALAKLADVTPLDDRLGEAVRGVGGMWRRAAFMAREVGSALWSGQPLGVVPEVMAPPHERRVQVHQRVLSAEQVERLRVRARQERTTIHGALSAAMALAIVHERPRGARGTIALGSPVNLRDRIVPAPGEAVGLYVGLAEYRRPHRRHPELWDLARAIRDDLQADLDAGQPELVLSAMDGLHRALGGLRVAPERFGVRYAALAPNTTGLTNLGRLELEATIGEVEVAAIHFAVSPSALGTFVATATGWGGGILWNFCSQAPLMSRARAEALVDAVVERVEACVRA